MTTNPYMKNTMNLAAQVAGIHIEMFSIEDMNNEEKQNEKKDM